MGISDVDEPDCPGVLAACSGRLPKAGEFPGDFVVRVGCVHYWAVDLSTVGSDDVIFATGEA